VTTAPQTTEERVADKLMDTRRRVKVFISESIHGVDSEVNQWLDAHPRAEILGFFPVSVAGSVSVAVAATRTTTKMTTRDDGGQSFSSDERIDERSKDLRIIAIGVYYAEPKEGA